MEINIKIYSPKKIINLYLNGEKNLVNYNGKMLNKNLDKEIASLLTIFSKWENNYSCPFVLDSEHFEIEMINNCNKQKFVGNGAYPNNYKEFKQLIGEIINCF